VSSGDEGVTFGRRRGWPPITAEERLHQRGYIVPGISGYVYRAPGAEQLVMNELIGMVTERPLSTEDAVEIRASARRIISLVRYHTP